MLFDALLCGAFGLCEFRLQFCRLKPSNFIELERMLSLVVKVAMVEAKLHITNSNKKRAIYAQN